MVKRVGLFFIIFLSIFLRFYQITQSPPSLFADEVDIANQVNSLRRFQTDYYGNFFPTHFHSFSDWRTPFQIYSSYLISFFATSPEIIVRLPSAIFSSLSILVFYLLTRSLTTTFLLAINPWSIHYGRTGFEVSGMIFCLLSGVYFFQNFLKKSKTSLLLISIFFFISSAYFYSTAKLFLLLLAPIILFSYPEVFKLVTRKTIFSSIIFLILLLTPLTIDTIKGRSGFRFSYISIFSEPQLSKTVDYQRYLDVLKDHSDQIGVSTSLESKLIHNKYLLIAETFFKNYLQSFSTNFLFLSGDSNLRHSFGNFGLFYIVELLLITFGLFSPKSKLKKLFILWLIIAPIPFSLTRDSLGPHATRLFLMVPPLVFLSSQGLSMLKLKLIPLFLILLNFFVFWHHYQYHYPQLSARFWHANIRETIFSIPPNIQPIFISDKPEPFLPFFMLYSNYQSSTANFSNNISSYHADYFDGKTINHIYYFGNINFNALNLAPPGSLFIVSSDEINQVPPSLTLIKQIKGRYLESPDYYLLQL